MKLINLREDVVDLDKRREKKQLKRGWSIQGSLRHIDQTIEFTIKDLMEQGINEENSRRVVMKHLSDLVMSHDLIG